jgi:monovalent cation/hydrogen antiporter
MPREYVMRELEQLLGLFVAAVILAAAARRVGAPYPVFLALGGALLAFFPGAPALTVPLELALALFVAPVLLDAAYDTSLRDLRDNWLPVTSLVVLVVRQAVLAMRADDEIGEDAFHLIEEELDWLEMASARDAILN